MNLSAKSLGQSALLAVALFFFSCSDDVSTLGYKNPVPKFKSSYIEIPITTSVFMYDSVRSSNRDALNDINRLVIGQYNDPVFGTVTSRAFTQFYPLEVLVDEDSLVYESIDLSLLVDYYVYGTEGTSVEKINVNEITQDIPYTSSTTTTNNTGGQQKPLELTTLQKRLYFTNSSATIDPTPLASVDFSVDYAYFKQQADDATFDTTLVTTPLSDDLGHRIFDLMQTDAFKNKAFVDRSVFLSAIKGLCISTEQSDKIIRFIVSSASRIRLHYRDNGKSQTKYYVDFPLGTHDLLGVTSFNEITDDRTGTPLDGIVANRQDFDTGNDLRYIQAGSGIVTKIDFSKFVDFGDTIDQMVINSAELVIKGIEDPGTFDPPGGLLVKLIDDTNKPLKLGYPGRNAAYQQDITYLNDYQHTFTYDSRNISLLGSVPFDSTFNIVNDAGTFLTLNYSSDDKNYKGTASLFFQQLFKKGTDRPKYTKAVLIPYLPSTSSNIAYGLHVQGKEMNRVAFNKDNIILRVYYTVPTVNLKP